MVFKSRFPDNQECNSPMHYVYDSLWVAYHFFQKSWMMKSHNFHHYYSTYKGLAAFKAKLGEFRPTSWFRCISSVVPWAIWLPEWVGIWTFGCARSSGIDILSLSFSVCWLSFNEKYCKLCSANLFLIILKFLYLLLKEVHVV